MVNRHSLVSLWDMLELNAKAFLGAATQLARLHTVVNGLTDAHDQLLVQASVDAVIPCLESLKQESLNVGAKLASLATDRLLEKVQSIPCQVTVGNLAFFLNDIESRFADQLEFVKLFIIHDDQSALFGGADGLLGQPTASLYPSAWFDCEEAAKCICLSRATACVFHCMRLLEIGIKALAAHLQIPDPTKPAERNWGVILGAIKKKIDDSYPESNRMPGSQGAFLEKIYASLDAAKNPWRNGTMHVDSIYTEQEASHILQCSAVLLQTMAKGFDETGTDISNSLLLLNS